MSAAVFTRRRGGGHAHFCHVKNSRESAIVADWQKLRTIPMIVVELVHSKEDRQGVNGPCHSARVVLEQRHCVHSARFTVIGC
jgi:hypothetical protein